jgi:hypothetical protein
MAREIAVLTEQAEEHRAAHEQLQKKCERAIKSRGTMEQANEEMSDELRKLERKLKRADEQVSELTEYAMHCPSSLCLVVDLLYLNKCSLPVLFLLLLLFYTPFSLLRTVCFDHCVWCVFVCVCIHHELYETTNRWTNHHHHHTHIHTHTHTHTHTHSRTCARTHTHTGPTNAS